MSHSAKPTLDLLQEVTERLPAKFSVRQFNFANFTILLSVQMVQAMSTSEEGLMYNVTPEPKKSGLVIITQVGDHTVTSSITLTSPVMREEPNQPGRIS